MSYPTGVPISYTAVASTSGFPGAAFDYAWTFDDGTTGNTASLNHTWSLTGNRGATVVATDRATRSSASASKTIKVMSYLWSGLAGMTSASNVLGPGVMGVQGNKLFVVSSGAPGTGTYIYDIVADTWSAGPTLHYDSRISSSIGQRYMMAPVMPNGDIYVQQVGFGAPMSVNLATGVVTNLAGQGSYSIVNYACMGGDGNAYYFMLSGSFNRTYMHNLTSNTWSLKSTLSPALFGIAPIYIGNNKMFMINRSDGFGYTYNHQADTWLISLNASGLTTGTDAVSSLLLMPDGRVFCCGGSNGKGSIFDPATNSFTVSAGTDPTIRTLPGLYMMENGKIHVINSGGVGTITTSTIFDPVTGGFSGSYSMGHGHMNNVIVSPIDGKPIAFGQNSSAPVFTSVFDGV